MQYPMNDNWFFTPCYSDDLRQAKPDSLPDTLEVVRIPHTTTMLQANYSPEEDYQQESAYLHILTPPAAWRGRRVQLRFGAAAHQAEVFLNGVSLYTHSCGYTAFTVDVTNHLRFEEKNLILVRVDSRETLNIPPFGKAIDYMTFGGLYREITLEVRGPAMLENVFVNGSADGVFSVSSEAVDADGCTLRVRVTDDHGAELWKTEQPFVPSLTVSLPNAPRWSTDAPRLCTARLELWRDNRLMDEQTVRFGFRTVDFRADGLYLNGKKIKLRGLDRHQSWPYMGYAVPDRAQALDAEILKYELGCNAVRTSHYPQSHAFLDRCDELGLLVFTEIPGWQYIGDEAWKDQAIENVKEMVLQYRNHPSIFLWGVRINESADDDAFYQRTNAMAHQLDPTRPTGGVRNFPKSHLLEDVYTYNDFVHNGTNRGCDPKRKVTPDTSKGYLVSEYNGHMFPTKSGDWEGKRLEHALRHARVLDAVAAQTDIAGCFGWCMFDYNTHQDFGSGDRVCYHGVLDMFRNPKPAAAVYAAEGRRDTVLEISSTMDIGEHPAGDLGTIYAFTNADSIRLYKNGEFVREFFPGKEYPHMEHPPIPIDDRIGSLLEEKEGFSPSVARQLRQCLLAAAKYGTGALPPRILLLAAKLMLINRLTYQQAVDLFGKYVAGWGEIATSWRFEAIRNGQPVAQQVREPVQRIRLEVRSDTQILTERNTWDMATVRIRAVDQNGCLAPFASRAVTLTVEGDAELIGPSALPLEGGMTGTYLRTLGRAGQATLTLQAAGMEPVTLNFTIQKEGNCDATQDAANN